MILYFHTLSFSVNCVPTSSTATATATATNTVLFTRMAVLRQHTSFVSSVCAHPRGMWLLSAGYDGMVCFWDVEAVIGGNRDIGSGNGYAKEDQKDRTEV